MLFIQDHSLVSQLKAISLQQKPPVQIKGDVIPVKSTVSQSLCDQWLVGN